MNRRDLLKAAVLPLIPISVVAAASRPMLDQYWMLEDVKGSPLLEPLTIYLTGSNSSFACEKTQASHGSWYHQWDARFKATEPLLITGICVSDGKGTPICGENLQTPIPLEDGDWLDCQIGMAWEFPKHGEHFIDVNGRWSLQSNFRLVSRTERYNRIRRWIEAGKPNIHAACRSD